MAITFEEQCLEAADKAAETVIRLAFKESDWEHCKASGDVKVYRRPSENVQGRHCFKVEFPVNANCKETCKKCYPATDIANRRLPKAYWDTQTDKAVLFDLAGNKGEVREDTIVTYNLSKAQLKGLVSPRDSLTVWKCHKADKFYGFTSASVEHPECHPMNKYVRCHSFPSGAFFMPDLSDPENKCQTIIIFETDLKVQGVPIGIIEAGTPAMLVSYVHGMRDSAKLPYEDLSDLPGMKGQVVAANI